MCSAGSRTAADWDAAAAEVRAGFQPGDLIVFAPAWSDAVGRLHLGDLIPPEMAARADESGYRRVWEVSIRGARAPETLADVVKAGLLDGAALRDPWAHPYHYELSGTTYRLRAEDAEQLPIERALRPVQP